MLPQDPIDPFAWKDAYFADWIKSSPYTQSSLKTNKLPTPRRIRIKDLISSPTLAQPGPSKSENEMVLHPADDTAGSLVRSPRSADLVGLCRRNSMIRGHEAGASNVSGVMRWQQRDPKGKGKAREIGISEHDGLPVYPNEEWEQIWEDNVNETQARNLDGGNYNFSDHNIDMDIDTNLTDRYRMAGAAFDSSYIGLRSSPTWGRRKHASSSSDLNYDEMEIEDLMKGMEVYSDTDYEQNDHELLDLSRILFRHSCSPAVGSSSKLYTLTADGKRRASPGLEMPVCKKRYTANPLKYQSTRSSANPLRHGNSGNGMTSRRVQEAEYNRWKCERAVSLAHPLQGDSHMIYGYESITH